LETGSPESLGRCSAGRAVERANHDMAPSRFLPRLDYPAHLRSAEGAGRNSKHQQIAPLRRLVPSLRRNRCELRHFRKHFDGSLFPAESIVAAENGAVEMTARPTIGGCPDRAGTIFSPGFFAPHSNWPLAFAEINQCECESRGEPIYPRLLLILAMTIRGTDATMFVVSRCTFRWLAWSASPLYRQSHGGQ
jgi:hypothetical protein